MTIDNEGFFSKHLCTTSQILMKDGVFELRRVKDNHLFFICGECKMIKWCGDAIYVKHHSHSCEYFSSKPSDKMYNLYKLVTLLKRV